MSRQIREVRVIDLITYAAVPFALLIGLVLGYVLWLSRACPFSWPSWVWLLITLAAAYLPLRRFLIGLVLLYKAFAPLDVRSQCRFVPTCSTYMIMAIQKYGIVIGVTKGIGRLIRCRPPNGGEDYP